MQLVYIVTNCRINQVVYILLFFTIEMVTFRINLVLLALWYEHPGQPDYDLAMFTGYEP
jgi:hypothetical protein